MGEPMDRSRRVFCALSRFEAAFPTLEDAIFEYEVYDFGNEQPNPYAQGSSSTRWFRMASNGGLLRCENPRCQRGGYEIDVEVMKMLAEGVIEKGVTLRCPGDEGTPKRSRGDSCLYSVRGKIKLVPKAKQEYSVPES